MGGRFWALTLYLRGRVRFGIIFGMRNEKHDVKKDMKKNMMLKKETFSRTEKIVDSHPFPQGMTPELRVPRNHPKNIKVGSHCVIPRLETGPFF